MTHGKTGIQLNSEHLRLGPLASRWMAPALLIGIIGLVVGVVLGATKGDHWHHFLRAYLTAYTFVLSISLGSLFFLIVQHITRMGALVVVRRFAEGLASNLLWLPFGFIPVVIGLKWGHMYHWADPATVAADPILQHKAVYLNTGFWIVRAIFFFAVWAILARVYTKSSIAQDADGKVEWSLKMGKLAPIALILYALTQTFASIDWIKSLDPHWFSTMFGVYFFAVSCTAAFATIIICMYFTQRAGKLRNEITLDHWQDMGKLLFAFGVVFWAYIAFSQYMLIWYANIPEETAWYMVRGMGGWRPVTAVLILGHFVIPFLLLVSKHPKRIKPVLTLIAGWMLVMVWVDLYWLVMPIVDLSLISTAESLNAVRAMEADGTLDIGWHPHVMDIALALGFLGLAVAGVCRTLGGELLIPAQDPRLSESLNFENM